MGSNFGWVLFDGHCRFCNRTVNFLIHYDRKSRLRFVPWQSDQGIFLRNKFKIPDTVDSVVLMHNGKVYLFSDAAINTLALLGFPFNVSRGLVILPRRLRDAAYRWFAANRYHWFGVNGTCRVPGQNERERFPDLNEVLGEFG